MNPRDEVLLTYGTLAEGQKLSGLRCPSCEGGRSHERSFSVGRENGVLWWKCFRASCAFSGASGSRSVMGGTAPVKGAKEQSKIVRVEALPDEWLEFLENKYAITEETIRLAGWRLCPDYDGRGTRILMPVYGPDGLKRHENFRSYDGSLPKTLINKQSDEETISWYRWAKYNKTLVIVEDQPSAVRIAQELYVDSLALLGVLLNPARLNEIKQQNYERIYLALDNDATAHAVKLGWQLRARLPQLRIKALDKDVKDMSPEEFQGFIDEVSLP